jgi:hypothetical protein
VSLTGGRRRKPPAVGLLRENVSPKFRAMPLPHESDASFLAAEFDSLANHNARDDRDDKPEKND